MDLKPGQRVVVPSTAAEFIVVSPPADTVEITLGAPGGDDDPLLLGKRYLDEVSGLELLCVRAGDGPLEVDGRRVLLKGAKPLPSSD